jgi:hypothetical protein
MEQDAVDAPPMEGLVVLVVTPEGWGGAPLQVTVGCSSSNPTTLAVEGIECRPKTVMFEYKLTEPSTLVVLDVDIPRPCYLHLSIVARRAGLTKYASKVIGVHHDSRPVVIGLPYSIYEPVELS